MHVFIFLLRITGKKVKFSMRASLRKSKFNYFPEDENERCRVHLMTFATLTRVLFWTGVWPKIQYVHFILHFNCCWQFSQSLKLCYFRWMCCVWAWEGKEVKSIWIFAGFIDEVDSSWHRVWKIRKNYFCFQLN